MNINITPAPNQPERRNHRTPDPSSGVHEALNIVLFTALIILLLFGVALSFPALRDRLNIDGFLGKLPPTPAALTTGIRISEVMTSNKSTLPDETGAFPDWIELVNAGGTAVSLNGYTLSDRDNRPKLTFPDITLAPGEFLIVFASGVESMESGKPIHAAMRLSASGETLYLNDNNNDIVEMITIPAMSSDESYARNGTRWVRTASPTPGYENSTAGRELFVSGSTPAHSGLQLNEIMASNSNTILDGDGVASDWIELFNASAIPIDLSRYALSDDPARPVKWRFPDGAMIQPYSTYLIFASGQTRQTTDRPHASFKLRADHGVVILSDLMGNTIDSTEYDNLQTDTVWARRRNAEPWEQSGTPSPAQINP
ncbi:hypothetical protein AGMMS49992_16080 [Clostridia bacterium]|nr:hypothetical protein AGMMS49992_16080 [Clostridia bacterium]